MKVAYFGYDNFASCLPALLTSGHSIEVIFTGNDNLHCKHIIAFAKKYNIDLQYEKPNLQQLTHFVENGVECFLAAEYPWKIPLPDELHYAVNIHPTLLPYGRGKTPISYLLLNQAGHSGLTFHKMTAEMDKGDILIQQSVQIDKLETYDSYVEKLSLLAPQLLSTLFLSFNEYYLNTIPQSEGSDWPCLNTKDQTIEWNNSVEDITQQYRAFGSLGVYATINSRNVLLTALDSTQMEHTSTPGTLVHTDSSRIIVAARNGFISVNNESIIFLS